MIYLLDTDTLIFVLQGIKRTASTVRRTRARKILLECRKERAYGHTLGLSTITVSELEYGCWNSGQYQDEAKYVAKLTKYFAAFPYDTIECPLQYGRIRHELKQKGQILGAMDMLIAAHALALDATLVTNNLADFGRLTGLKVLNWS